MLNIHFLAGTSLALLCACAGASAQDTQPAPRPAPRVLLRHAPQGALLAGPRMREGGPRLGVTVDTTPDGLKVTTVEDGSLAASAGIKADDVLMRIGERRVHEVDDVALALHGTEPGSKVSVTVIRPGEGLVTLEGTLPEPKKEDEPKASAPDGMKGGFLGVQMKSEAEDDSQSSSGGVAVAGVVPDSAAWFAGLEEGDRLMSIDGKALANAEDLAGTVSSKEPGSLVELRYLRNGEEQTTKVRLGHRGMLGMLGGMGQPGGAMSPRILRLRSPQGGGLDVDTPDGQLFQMDDDGQFDMPGFPDLQQLFSLPQGGTAESVEVRIDGDHMTVTHDGATETYERDADGNWIKQDGAAPAPQGSHGA